MEECNSVYTLLLQTHKEDGSIAFDIKPPNHA
jgi:hypothetical protein